MKNETRLRPLRAFTLIEMLIVIAIIGILAALILPLTSAVKKRGLFSRTQAQLAQLTLAIESYKEKLGHYPPDNPVNPAVNQLYFEFLGTTVRGQYFETLDGSARIPTNAVASTFLGVEGFVNFSASTGGDDGPVAINFLKGVKAYQVGELAPDVKVFVGPAPWPTDPAHQPGPVPSVPSLNPWRYVSSNPTNNPNSYDLWIDLIIGGKTNRVSNWSKQPQIVSTP